MTRPSALDGLFAMVTLGMTLAACGPPAPASPPESTSAPASPTATAVNTAGAKQVVTAPPAPAATSSAVAALTLPADAAPLDRQVLVMAYDTTADFTTLNFWESVYKRGGARSDLMNEPLVRLNKNFEIEPAAATAWSVDQSGLVWTFKLDPNLIWSDDTPVTADDFVATFRYGADPKHAWDFSWFFNGVVKNWEDAVAGKQSLDALGVRSVDAHTLQIETQEPAPYLPAMMVYALALQKKALDTYGGLYNSNVATSVSNGPFLLKEWRKGDRLTFEANPKYKGNNKPLIQRVINIGASPLGQLAAYQNGELDFVDGNSLSVAENDVVNSDPKLSKEVHPHYGDFRTDYLFFDEQNPPFNNVKVRLAIAHVIPRQELIQQIIRPSQAIPAFSFLMPGFPAANSDGLKDLQAYDPKLAKQLLVEAGFSDGTGFPKVTLWLRAETPARQAVAQAIAASIKQNLGIEVEVSNKENKSFMDAMNVKPTQIQFGMVSYGFDFLDPYNMLSVWLGGGRHNWNNAQYDAQVKKAASFSGAPAVRTKMFQDAERLLVSEAGGVFIDHRTVADVYKPYLKGSELEPDKNGFAAMHWPNYSSLSTLVGSLYIGKDVVSSGRKLP